MKSCCIRSIVFLLLVILPACSTMSTRQPDPGHALINATPEKSERDRLDGIRLVSINGRPAPGTKASLTPGRNNVKIRFTWPQGGRQEVDLRFHATEGHLYSVQYDVHPPYVNRFRQPTRWDESASELTGGLANLIDGGDPGDAKAAGFFIPVYLALGTANTIERVTSHAGERSKPADYIDIMVVAKNSPEGIVRRVRAYPDGRIDARPWAAQAQMGRP